MGSGKEANGVKNQGEACEHGLSGLLVSLFISFVNPNLQTQQSPSRPLTIKTQLTPDSRMKATREIPIFGF